MQNAEMKIDSIFQIVSTHANRLKGPHIEADDLTQITIEKALRSKALPASPSINWLYAATRNAKNDILRKVSRERENVDTNNSIDTVRLDYFHGEHLFVPSIVLEPSDPYISLAIDQAVDQLSSEKKEAFLLFVDGYSYTQIAHMTGANLNTVRSRLHFAKRYLQRALAVHR